jgi:hypothetical protein
MLAISLDRRREVASPASDSASDVNVVGFAFLDMYDAVGWRRSTFGLYRLRYKSYRVTVTNHFGRLELCVGRSNGRDTGLRRSFRRGQFRLERQSDKKG